MGLSKKFYISLLIGIIAGTLISFTVNGSIRQIESMIENMINKKFNFSNYILMFNISFLKARRAEKNLIIFKSPQYKDEIERYLRETDNYLIELESINSGMQGKYSIEPLKNNIADYKSFIKELYSLLASGSQNEEALIKLTDRIKNLNDTIAENVMYLSSDIRKEISQMQGKLENYYSSFRRLPGIIVIIAIFGIYAAVFYDDFFAWLLRAIR